MPTIFIGKKKSVESALPGTSQNTSQPIILDFTAHRRNAAARFGFGMALFLAPALAAGVISVAFLMGQQIGLKHYAETATVAVDPTPLLALDPLKSTDFMVDRDVPGAPPQ